MEGLPFGEEGLRYLTEKMSGGLALSHAVLDSIELAAGTTLAFPPAQHPSPAGFATGTGVARDDRVNDGIALVRGSFAIQRGGAFVVEEPLPRRSDPSLLGDALTRERQKAWLLGENVYSLAFPTDDDERIREVVAEIYPFPGWGGAGFVSDCLEAVSYATSYELRQASLPCLAVGTQLIIAGAYDGEGFVVWRR
jgi:hypothetical protein